MREVFYVSCVVYRPAGHLAAVFLGVPRDGRPDPYTAYFCRDLVGCSSVYGPPCCVGPGVRKMFLAGSRRWGNSAFVRMQNLARLDHEWQRKKSCCNVIIETPKGRRNKFDYDEEHCIFKLGGLLAEGLSSPFDFGFIPSTRGDDGDPLDVMVLMEEPANVNCPPAFLRPRCISRTTRSCAP